MLASWLFAQYLLTNDVQIPYSQTEGYVPVTLKAQQDKSYIEYISGGGVEGDLYYDVKLKAVRLLLEHTDDTFITPVFNGSASLRDASGHLIESVTKSVRRGQTVDDEYMDKLFSDTEALYHLDSVTGGGRAELDEMPAGSKALLISLGAAWVIMAAWVAAGKIRRRSTP